MKPNNILVATTLTLLALAATSTAAQPMPERMPRHAFQLRFGYLFPHGEGALWDDSASRFTLAPEDFNGPVWGLSFVTAVNDNFEVGVHGDWYGETVVAEERGFVDEFGYAVVHDTTLEQRPFAIDVRLIPGGRYRGGSPARSRLKPVFYIGAGLGVNIWDYEESGDFVDAGDPDLPIYYGTFKESGEALEARVLAGLELPLSPGFNVLVEGRYSWAQGDLNRDLAGFETIDLGGAWAFVGASFRF
jgi:hypothetical protein